MSTKINMSTVGRITDNEYQPPGAQIGETYQSDEQDESFSTHTLWSWNL